MPRPPGPDARLINLYLPTEVCDRLDARAHLEGSSRAAMVRLAIDVYLASAAEGL